MLGSVFSTIGNIGSAAVSGAGSLVSGAGQLVGGAAQAVWQAPGAIYGAGEGIIKALPTIAEQAKPIAEVLGGVYGAYTSYEQAKAAREAAAKYGSQTSVVVPGNTPVSASPPFYSIAGNPSMNPPITTEAMAGQSDTERLIMWGGLAVLAVLVLKKKR
jgi:X-X-X-Leu-X-X-Gly heptad repeat protein